MWVRGANRQPLRTSSTRVAVRVPYGPRSRCGRRLPPSPDQLCCPDGTPQCPSLDLRPREATQSRSARKSQGCHMHLSVVLEPSRPLGHGCVYVGGSLPLSPCSTPLQAGGACALCHCQSHWDVLSKGRAMARWRPARTSNSCSMAVPPGPGRDRPAAEAAHAPASSTAALSTRSVTSAGGNTLRASLGPAGAQSTPWAVVRPQRCHLGPHVAARVWAEVGAAGAEKVAAWFGAGLSCVAAGWP